jgi:hypothetical protein
VSAYGKLASILGMDAPIKQEIDVTHRGGVMIVPMMPTAEDWEKVAEEKQAQLKGDVRI